MDEKKTGSLQSVTGSNNVLRPESITFDKGSWWSRRSSLEKKMVALLALFILAAVILLVVVVVLVVQRNNAAEDARVKPAVCLTPECVATAGRLMDRMNVNADPCDNFYDYACGSWMEKNVIAEDKSTKNIFNVLSDKLLIKLQNVLEAPAVDGETSSVREAKKFYKSCIDTDAIEARKGKPLVDFLQQFGGWPVLSASWNESAFNMEDTLAKSYSYGFGPLILMYVTADAANSNLKKLIFDQPTLGLSGRENFLGDRNSTALKAYEDYIIRTAVALGADPVAAKDQARALVDFEIQIANITVPLTGRSDLRTLYNPMSLAQMAQNYSQFNWLKFTRDVMSGEGINVDITAEEIVINQSPPYFERLFPILSKTPKRVIANYVIWLIIKEETKLLDSSFRDSNNEFNKALTGTSVEPPRWKDCITSVNTYMKLAVGRLYVDAYFKESAKSDMLNIISYLKTSFKELLEEATWLDDSTRAVAKEKAEVMSEKIGYPQALKDNSYLDDYYRHYVFNSSLYFENYQIGLQQSVREIMRQLRWEVDRSEWLVQPAVVNAFYYASWNEVVFPAGILQPPFYSENQPSSVNFGSVGSFVGHEITHGFDNRGRQYDKDGNLLPWWAPDVIGRFQTAAMCFVNQSSNFVSPEAGLKVNGLLTLGEDIADSGGVKQSYRAYRKWVADRGAEEAPLPGVSLNHNQLFFLSWAQVWCAKIRKQAAIQNIYTDFHSPNRLRAFAPMRNMPEFAQVFNCRPGSYMNPATKCAVW